MRELDWEIMYDNGGYAATICGCGLDGLGISIQSDLPN